MMLLCADCRTVTLQVDGGLIDATCDACGVPSNCLRVHANHWRKFMNQTETAAFTQLTQKLDVLIAKIDALEAQLAAQPQMPDNTADIQAQLDKANAELAKFP